MEQSPETAADEKDGSQLPVSANVQQIKQVNVNNTIKEIISDIDSNIREQERIASLKQEELKLLQKQHELAQQIKEQQLLAQRLVSQNDKLQQQYEQQQQSNSLAQQPQQQQYQQQYEKQPSAPKFETLQETSIPQTTVSKYSTFEETKDGNVITKKTSSYEAEESSNVTKRIDLQKIFTPATDAEEILPRNRKLYASSAFYTPGLHPTVEDQVELARRISHSLSDISNHQSKGQSMYVNRKKRSVKWVHEGQGDEEEQVEEISEEQFKENADQQCEPKRSQTLDKLPLRLLMNPRGQVLDYNSLRDSLNIESGLLSPEKCAELVTALQTQKGRGAELFAKRRKKSDNWIVDEQHASTQNPSGLPDFHTYQPPKPPTSPSIVPAYSDVGKHRVQLNLHQEQVLEKYARPGLQVVKSPWEAALETGSASAAFVEGGKPQHAMTPTPSPAPIYDTTYNQNAYSAPPAPQVQQAPQQPKYSKPSAFNDHQKDLAYKPSLPQGWKAPSVSLPKASQNIYDENFYGFGYDRLQTQFGQYEESECSSVSCYEGDCNSEVMRFNAPQCSEPIEIPNSKLPTALSQSEKYERVDVRKQLLQLEERMKEVARLRQQQEKLRNRRDRNQQKWTWQQKQANLQKNQNGENMCAEDRTDEEKQVEEHEEYIKVAVRDLIESFEQQSIQAQQDDQTKADEETQKISAKPNIGDSKGVKCNQEELYMPKEIPIESYAPPPVVNLKPTSTYSPIYQSQDNQHTWTPAFSPAPAPAPISPSPYNDYSYSKATPVDHNTSAFPVASKPAQKPQYGGGVSNFPVSANVPPKQQYWEPTSYQKVHQPSAGQKVPQVNFNPSPLPYDKLAKFENPDTSSDSYQQQRYLAPSHGHGSKVRNASPAPFATRSPVSLPYSPTMQQYSNYGSTSYSPSIPSSTPTYGHHNPNELLHGPTFNTAARGWKSPGGSNSFYGKPRAPLTTGGHMPYTDF